MAISNQVNHIPTTRNIFCIRNAWHGMLWQKVELKFQIPIGVGNNLGFKLQLPKFDSISKFLWKYSENRLYIVFFEQVKCVYSVLFISIGCVRASNAYQNLNIKLFLILVFFLLWKTKKLLFLQPKRYICNHFFCLLSPVISTVMRVTSLRCWKEKWRDEMNRKENEMKLVKVPHIHLHMGKWAVKYLPNEITSQFIEVMDLDGWNCR